MPPPPVPPAPAADHPHASPHAPPREPSSGLLALAAAVIVACATLLLAG